ncbi:hypothetical protein HDU67_005153, partial [Dinochytrium kinnereticum]
MQEGDFQLVIPDVTEDDEDNMSEFEPANFRVGVDSAAHASSDSNNVAAHSSVDGAQALLEQLSKIRIQRPDLPPMVETHIEAEFSIKRLCGLIKHVVRRYRPSKEKTEQKNIAEKSNEPVIDTIWDFFDTKTSQITEPPEPGSVDFQNLQKTLLLCLYEESAELRFETAKILVQIKGFWNLARWDGIAFRNTLMEMLREGTSDESFLAGKTLCDMGYVDVKAIRRVRRGLGDLDDT